MLTNSPAADQLLEPQIRSDLPSTPCPVEGEIRSPYEKNRRRPRLIEAAAFGVYVAVLVFAVAHHEPWADEVQAWLLGRDLSPIGLAVHQLRYEGSPGLWQFLLWPIAHAHLPIIALNMVGASAAAVGVALLIFVSPLPLLLRLGLPLSYFFLYQYAVVSRSYNLLIPLFLGLAAVFSSRFRRPLRYTGMLALIAGVSVQAMIVAGLLFALFVHEVFRRLDDHRRARDLVRTPILLFTGVNVLLVAVLWPTADNSARIFSTAVLHRPDLWLERSGRLLLERSFTGEPWLNLLLLCVTTVWLFQRRALATFLLPLGAEVLFMGALQPSNATYWLGGLDTIILVFGLWIGFESDRRRPVGHLRFAELTTRGMLVVLASTCAIQMSWSFAAVTWDASHAYGPGKEVAAFLAAHDLSRTTIATDGDYYNIDLEPYLPSGRFVNLPSTGAYYYWSKSRNVDITLFTPLAQATPRVLIDTIWWQGKKRPHGYPKWFAYRPIARFPGEIFWHGSVIEHEDMVVFLRDGVILPPAR